MELILASGSPRRAELMRNCGYEFTVLPSAADESGVAAEAPDELVKQLSLMKARSVFLSLPEERRAEAVVMGSDTVVVLGNEILGKPRSRDEAAEMLRRESGRVNTVYTGLAIVRDRGDGELEISLCDSTDVHFRALSEEEIEAYVATGEPLDKAGAYGIQGVSSMFIERIEGSFFTVVGLPVHLVYSELKRLGINPLGMRPAVKDQ